MQTTEVPKNEKNREEEAELLQKLQQVPIIDMLLENVQTDAEKNESWLQKSQSTYDSRERTVQIQKDALQIIWETQGDKKSAQKQIVESLCYEFSKNGYMPLEPYRAANGQTVPVERVCCLVASVVCLKMKEKFQDCQFPNSTEENQFTYTVPRTEGWAWF